MFPFSQSVTPAVRSHLDAQVSFFNDVSKSLSRSFQNLVDLNIQLTQTMLEESSIAGQQLLTSERPTDAISVAASRAQPATEKLRAYQQHISRVAADAQVELARVAEEHVQETSRTARTLADEVARVASEETERSIRTSQETIRNFRDPFQVDGARRGNGSAQAHGNLQSAGQGSSGGIQAEGSVSVQGGAQGNQAGKGGAGKGAQA
jgi:phasin family protein